MPDQLHDILERARVISEKRAAELTGLSAIHLRRMRKRGVGPKFVRLTPSRRVGYQLGPLLDWLAERSCDRAA